MENDMFNVPQSIGDHSHMAFDTVSSHMFSSPFYQSGIHDYNNYGDIMAGEPLFPSFQEESLSNLFAANQGVMVNGLIPISRNMSHVEGASYGNSVGSNNQREHLTGNPLSATSLAHLLSSSTSLQDNLNNRSIASNSALLPGDVRNSMASDSCSTLNSSLTASANCEFGPQEDTNYFTNKKNNSLSEHPNNRWNYGEFPGSQLPSTRRISTVRPSYHVIGSSEPGWSSDNSFVNTDHQYGYSAASNELSLSLGSCQPSLMNMPNVPDQCSEISCSGLTQVTSKDNRYPHSSDLQDCSRVFQNSGHCEELSLDCGASQRHFPRVQLRSKYLHVAQEILAGIANYALEELDEMDDSVGGVDNEANVSLSSHCYSANGFPIGGSDDIPCSSGESKSHSLTDPPHQREENYSKKSELLTMLQMVDKKYNQCMDQIQHAASTYESATAANTPPMLAQFALRSISLIYKKLRERISSQIVLINHPSGEYTGDKERTFESSFIRKQWALQQLRRNEQQSWRPQRGLPEKSVSFLRAWMFQNFLHPYPKDNEKHMLALQSGLTRSQVSNWFINARVRLWKPLIEEMYSEVNKKNWTVEGSGCDSRSYVSIGNQRIQMN